MNNRRFVAASICLLGCVLDTGSQAATECGALPVVQYTLWSPEPPPAAIDCVQGRDVSSWCSPCQEDYSKGCTDGGRSAPLTREGHRAHPSFPWQWYPWPDSWEPIKAATACAT